MTFGNLWVLTVLLFLGAGMGCAVLDSEDKNPTGTQGTTHSAPSSNEVPSSSSTPGPSAGTSSVPSSSSAGRLQVVATPDFSQAPGTYYTRISVQITTSTPDAEIYYTTNGTIPTPSDSLYSNALSLGWSTNLTARAFKSGWEMSPVASAAYTIYRYDLQPCCGVVYAPWGGIWTSTSTDYPGQINNVTGAGGWWYSFSDAEIEGGTSTISWGNSEGEFNTKIESAGMINVNIQLGTGFDYPYAGVGFPWLNSDDGGPGAHDISSKPGLCIAYSSTHSVRLQLDWDTTVYDSDYYSALLPATDGSTRAVSKQWAAFSQSGWGSPHSLATALSQSTGVRFLLESGIEEPGNLRILSVGWSNACY